MKYQHVQPSEAVQIHLDVSSRFSLAIHWGTFALANEVLSSLPLPFADWLSISVLFGSSAQIEGSVGKGSTRGQQLRNISSRREPCGEQHRQSGAHRHYSADKNNIERVVEYKGFKSDGRQGLDIVLVFGPFLKRTNSVIFINI